ncbi:hydantoinase B/oxoprolinase family protein [Labrys monachus]|uniref:N-methylhydantoinase B n=1 Tax=Labrys monachus TaxID=217067 RepID=A0ABU0FA62_9HYPH|nr:hydantoinase B/oxoprolinase family protein [Labrys monachus]MDQ0390945.1 N-methylhydantoinase B [Labrys monachus]
MTDDAAATDPLLLEIIRNGLDTVADDMALILMRTAYSAIIRDSMDYSTAVCDAQGQIVGQGLTTPMHLGSFYDAMRHLITQYGDDIHEGDLFIGNDPYLASGQHLPDIYIIRPFFHDGVLEGWATTIAHHVDVGGLVPGSNSIGATEIFQEGLRLPFLKLAERGIDNEAIWRIVEANVRVPHLVLGDIRAQVSATEAGLRGWAELFGRYGAARMRRALDDLHDLAERIARFHIAAIPDGVYSFTDHIDGLGEDPEPIVLHVALTVAGDEITADWAGTAAQVRGGINAPLSFTKSNVYAALRSIMPAGMPNCHGYTRPITVRAPEGTLVNCTSPAPCGARGITGYRIVDCMFGALAPALPDRLTADGAGGSTLPTFAGRHEGSPFVFSECIMGTWGASLEADGQDGVPHMASNQSNVPIEMIEVDYPLLIENYGLVIDSGGVGRKRGGLALRREYRILTDDCFLGVRSDKRRYRPHGLFGGGEGAPSTNVIEEAGVATTVPTLPTKPIRLGRGALFRHVMAGGGGYGDPFERDPAEVLEDVLDGRVSVAAARADYGVVVSADAGSVDRASTESLRRARVSSGEGRPSARS